jgi:hypothetical protein
MIPTSEKRPPNNRTIHAITSMATAPTAMTQLTRSEETSFDADWPVVLGTIASTLFPFSRTTQVKPLDRRPGGRPIVSRQTSETIDRNNEIGRTHRTMSVRVSARCASTVVAETAAVTFMSTLLLEKHPPGFRVSAQITRLMEGNALRVPDGVDALKKFQKGCRTSRRRWQKTAFFSRNAGLLGLARRG